MPTVDVRVFPTGSHGDAIAIGLSGKPEPDPIQTIALRNADGMAHGVLSQNQICQFGRFKFAPKPIESYGETPPHWGPLLNGVLRYINAKDLT